MGINNTVKADKNMALQFYGAPVFAYDMLRINILDEVGHYIMQHYSNSTTVMNDSSRHSLADEGIPEIISLEIMQDEGKSHLVAVLKADYLKGARRSRYFSLAEDLAQEKFDASRRFLDSDEMLSAKFGIPLSYGVAAGALKTLEFRNARINWGPLVKNPFYNHESVPGYLNRINPASPVSSAALRRPIATE